MEQKTTMSKLYDLLLSLKLVEDTFRQEWMQGLNIEISPQVWETIL